MIGDNHKGEPLYLWDTSSGLVWKGFGEKDTHPKYTGDVENGVPNGLGFLIYPSGTKYVGSWKYGSFEGEGTQTFRSGSKNEGDFKDWLIWNGIYYDKNGNIKVKFVNGEEIKQ